MASKKPAPRRTAASIPTPAEAAAVVDAKPAAVVGDKRKELAAAHETNVLTAVKGITPDAVIETVAKFRQVFQTKVDDIGSNLEEQARALQQVNQAIEIKEKRLQDLHGIEATALTLDDLRAKHEVAKAEFKAEIAEAKAAWEAEQEAAQQEREREEAEYEYERDRKRRLDEIEWNDKVAAAKRAEALRVEQFNRDLETRRAAIEAQEQEIKELRAAVADHPRQIDAAEKRGAAIEVGKLKKEHEHAVALTEAQHANALALLQTKHDILEAQIKSHDALVASLKADVAAANSRAAEVAAQALESAGGRAALDKVQETIAALQNNQKQGR